MIFCWFRVYPSRDRQVGQLWEVKFMILNKISVFESWNHDKTQLLLHIVEIKFDPKTVNYKFLVILQNIEIDRKYEADTQNMWFFVFCEGNMTFHWNQTHFQKLLSTYWEFG